jgi:CheY-like chemotaxis protein
MPRVTSEVTTDPAMPTSGSPTATVPHSLMRDLAHELRDALSPVSSSLDLLRLQNFDPQASRATTERIERGLRRALTLVDAFVLADECERGTLPLEPQGQRLGELLQAARALLGESLARRCPMPPAAPEVSVLADRAQTVRVLAALLQHAEHLAAPDGALALHVIDEGDSATAVLRFQGGARLRAGEECFHSWRSPLPNVMALRTARCLMRLQRGDLELRATADGVGELRVSWARATAVGATPSAAADRGRPPAAAGASAEPGTRLRILIVDDSAEVRKAYRDVLLALGYQVTEAANGEDALLWIESDAPDVALIDIHLPQMNGYRLAQTIKARGGSAVRLIMLSGMTMDDLTRRLSRQAGFDDCLDKMAGPAALHQLLQSPGTASDP